MWLGLECYSLWTQITPHHTTGKLTVLTRWSSYLCCLVFHFKFSMNTENYFDHCLAWCKVKILNLGKTDWHLMWYSIVKVRWKRWMWSGIGFDMSKDMEIFKMHVCIYVTVRLPKDIFTAFFPCRPCHSTYLFISRFHHLTPFGQVLIP